MVLNVTTARLGGRDFIPSFLVLVRILLRHCVHAPVSDDSIGAGAALGSVSDSPVSTRAWPSPRGA